MSRLVVENFPDLTFTELKVEAAQRGITLKALVIWMLDNELQEIKKARS